MMKMDSQPQSFFGAPSRCPTPGGRFPSRLKVSGHSLSLAADIGALEECLALERSCAARAAGFEGIQSPPAVPYCEFLILRSGDGRLQALCRLMRLDRDNPIRGSLASDRFRISPLLTALRYSREGILEMGIPVFAPDCDTARAARLLWTGMIRYLEGNGLGFVIGRDVLSLRAETAQAWPRLMEEHGLHPDLEVETRPAFDPRIAPRGQALGDDPGPDGRDLIFRHWPAGLQEALLRGCRLAGDPACDPAAGRLEFLWVASRDMLESDGTRDWRGGPGS